MLIISKEKDHLKNKKNIGSDRSHSPTVIFREVSVDDEDEGIFPILKFTNR